MTDVTTNHDLVEPLLPLDDEQDVETTTATMENGETLSSCALENDANNAIGSGSNGTEDFSIKEEISAMIDLGIPLAVSFFCRMVS